MSLFGRNNKNAKRQIIIQDLTIYEGCCEGNTNRYQLALTTLINNVNLQIMSLTITDGKPQSGKLIIRDKVTGQPVSGATFANTSFQSSDPNVFTVEVVDQETLKITPVGDGSADLTGSSDATYTNSLGNETTDAGKTFSTQISVATTPPPPTPNETELDVVFAPIQETATT